MPLVVGHQGCRWPDHCLPIGGSSRKPQNLCIFDMKISFHSFNLLTIPQHLIHHFCCLLFLFLFFSLLGFRVFKGSFFFGTIQAWVESREERAIVLEQLNDLMSVIKLRLDQETLMSTGPRWNAGWGGGFQEVEGLVGLVTHS